MRSWMGPGPVLGGDGSKSVPKSRAVCLIHDRDVGIHGRDVLMHDRDVHIHDRDARIHDRDVRIHDRGLRTMSSYHVQT